MSKSVSIVFLGFSALVLIALGVVSIIWRNPVSIVMTVLFVIPFVISVITLKRNWAKLE
jgi:hypothetical protein